MFSIWFPFADFEKNYRSLKKKSNLGWRRCSRFPEIVTNKINLNNEATILVVDFIGHMLRDVAASGVIKGGWNTEIDGEIEGVGWPDFQEVPYLFIPAKHSFTPLSSRFWF